MVSNVFKDLGFTDREAQGLERRSALMLEIEKYIKRNNLTQSAAAKILDVSQPRASDLLNGRMSLFSLDELVRLARERDQARSWALGKP